MSGLLSTARDALRAKLWPMPTLAVIAALVIGVLVPRLDAGVDDSLPGFLRPLLFTGDAEAARTVLQAVSGSLITVTSLTFSLTVVTLQLASSQFSPRLLRTFSRDLFVQGTLALFLGTFAYALTTLRAVRGSAGSDDQFVPRLAVTLSYVLAMASVFALVLFLAHLTQQIRVETMLRNVHSEASATMAGVLELRTDTPALRLPTPPASVHTVPATESGFLTWVGQRELVHAATEADAVVSLDVHPGSFLVRGVPCATFWSATGEAFGTGTVNALVGSVQAAVHTGFERTAAQDVGFGLRQLTDVANKALSPGINDPTTAVHALGHVSALLCDLADHCLGPKVVSDDDGRTRLVVHRPDFADLVETAIAQPRRYGATDPQVLAQLYQLLGDLAFRVPVELHPVVREQLYRLRATVAGQDFDQTERDALAQLDDRVEAHLDARSQQSPAGA